MDNKYILYILIGCFITICAVAYASYMAYNQLNYKIEYLRKEFDTLTNLIEYKQRNLKDPFQNDTQEKSVSNIPSNSKDISEVVNDTVIENTTVRQKGGSEINSLEKTQNEVNQLQHELQHIDHLIQSSDNDSNSVELLDGFVDDRIDNIINNKDYRDKLIQESKSIEPLTDEIVTKVHDLDQKHNTSVFEDLANVPSDNNSELHELIQQESELSKYDGDHLSNIKESFITENNSIEQLSELCNQDTNMSHQSEIYLDSDKIDTNESHHSNTNIILDDIEYNVIYKNFTNKQLKEYCRSNQLIVAGSKKILIDRLLDNNFGHLFHESNTHINITSN
jgi:hypothetical protein